MVFLYFIDYTKAFERVQHEIVILLTQLTIDGKDPLGIKNMSWEQRAAKGETGSSKKNTDILQFS